MTAERDFWSAFVYNPESNRWLLAPGLAPMDILAVCLAKVGADAAVVTSAIMATEIALTAKEKHDT